MADEPTSEKLAKALEQAAPPVPDWMVKQAREGYYDHFKSPLPFPITQLVKDLRDHGQPELAIRATRGEFDSTDAEAEAWTKSEEGQFAVRLFGDLLK